MALTLSEVKDNPGLLTFEIPFNDQQKGILRPLINQDAQLLSQFLSGLSMQTRLFYVLDSYDIATASEYCDAIAVYDKLRLVVQLDKEIIALMEFSFDIPDGDRERFHQYGIELDSRTVCRFGPCVADQFQNLGLGTAIFPYIKEAARQFDQQRIILWGGVFANNQRALHFYHKLGFQTAGSFLNQDGLPCIDMIFDI